MIVQKVDKPNSIYKVTYEITLKITSEILACNECDANQKAASEVKQALKTIPFPCELGYLSIKEIEEV